MRNLPIKSKKNKDGKYSKIDGNRAPIPSLGLNIHRKLM